MAAPNVTVKIVDESFVVRGFETISTGIGAAFSQGETSTHNLLLALGTNSELGQGYMAVDDLGEWVLRYNNKFGAFNGITANGATGHPWSAVPKGLTGVTLTNIQTPDPTFKALTTNGFIYNGLTGNMATQWWSIANFLQYGGSVVLGGETGSYTHLNHPIMDVGLHPDIDVVFSLENSQEQATATYALVAGRNFNTIGVVGAAGTLTGFGACGGGGAVTQSGSITTRESGLGQYGICVFGSKYHLGLDLNSNSLVETPLIPDYAGIICRTDRDYAPWYPPAGMARGRILNLVKLKEQLTPSNQNTLYDAQINYALTMPGEGTFMFGDKTMATSTSSFSRVNVSRLFIFLVNTIGPLAKRFLFELNDATTRELFVNTVTPILDRVQADRGITDYTIVCDESNNPPSVVDANEFVADIQVKPTKSINYITIRFTNKNT